MAVKFNIVNHTKPAEPEKDINVDIYLGPGHDVAGNRIEGAVDVMFALDGGYSGTLCTITTNGVIRRSVEGYEDIFNIDEDWNFADITDWDKEF